MRKYLYPYILLLCLLSVAAGSKASAATVRAKLDTVTLLMGRTTTLKLTVDQPKGVKGGFPMFSARENQEKGYVAVCNDSVEIRMPVKVDTTEQGNSLRIVYSVPVQSFDSGYYRLPELLYVAGGDSVRSNRVSLKVIPLQGVTKDSPIADYANVADPQDPSIFDSLPDWLYYYWWIILIALLAVAAIIYALLKYKKEGHILPRKPEPSPYVVAKKSLLALKEKNLWERGMEKEYFTELTEILRVYLYKSFGINAMEMTSRQILASLQRSEELRDKRPYFKQILSMADFVKFAKVRPLPEDNIEAYDNALRFVEETKPVEQPEPEKIEAVAKSKGKRKKLRKGGGK